MKKTIGWHLSQIKEVQEGLNKMHTQAMINIDAMHQHCGGITDDKGNYVMDRDKAILWFANGNHRIDYVTPDPI